MSRKTKDKKGAARADKAGSPDMKRLYLILGFVAVVGILAVGYSVMSSAFSSAAMQPVDLDGIEQDPARLIELAQGIELGDPNAPITIIEFADYQCPGCASFAQQVKPMLNLSFIESGEAKLVFYDFPLPMHQNSFIAARSARCAGDQGLYWEFHDELFRNQPRWSASTNPISLFEGYAQTAGAEASAFASCVKSDRHADVVTANMLLGQQLGVNSTPTIMVNEGRGMAQRLGSFDFETVRRAVEAAQQR